MKETVLRRQFLNKPGWSREGWYWGLLLISPWLLGLLLFKLIPIATSFAYSLTNY